MMKKLLVTTALISIATTASFADSYAPMAKTFDIRVGGEYNAQAGFRSQKSEYVKNSAGEKLGPSANNKSTAFDSEANLWINAHNTTASGLMYGAHVGIETTTQSNHRDGGKRYHNESFLDVEHKDMGRVEFGSTDAAAVVMGIDAENVASATGGVYGDWWKYVVLANSTSTVTANQSQFILNPSMPLDNDLTLLVNTTTKSNASVEKSRKLTYFTPKINGFQFGVTYIPDVKNVASTANLPQSAIANNGAHNAFSGGLTWEGKMHKDHALKVSLTGETGKPKAPSTATVKLENTSVYSIGGMYTFQDMLSFVLSYTGYGKTNMLKTATGATGVKSGSAVTGGAKLHWEKMTVSLTGMASEQNKNKAKAYSLGADYKMAPGLMPYAEVTMFDMKQRRDQDSTSGDVTELASHLKNKGTAFILGTKVRF